MHELQFSLALIYPWQLMVKLSQSPICVFLSWHYHGFHYFSLTCLYIKVWHIGVPSVSLELLSKLSIQWLCPFFFWRTLTVGIIYGNAITLETLKEFHCRKVQVVAEAGANIIAFETIRNKPEAQVFAKSCGFSITL